MTFARLRLFSLALLLGPLAATGCVSQTALDNALQASKALEEKNLELQARIDRLQQQVRLLTDEDRQYADSESRFRQRISELEAEIAALNQALAQAQAEMNELVAGADIGIDPRLANQLEALARANPDLMMWDEARGMIRLRSDLTFGSGSIEVRQGAAGALATLAQALQIPEAEPYEVRIVGHTDNVAVTSRPGRKFQNNWELSALRAIAVKDVLGGKGIGQQRMSIAGYGEYQPVVQNGPRGAEANRRVEIFLVRQRNPAPAAPAAAAPVNDAPAAVVAEPLAPDAPAEPDAAFK